MTDVVRPPVRGDIRIKGTFLEPRPKGTTHYGTDFGPQSPGVAGDEVVAPVDGALVLQHPISNYGNASVLERNNNDGTYSYFLIAHQSGYDDRYKLSPQNPTIPVNAGDVVGFMGNTGASALHKPIPVHAHLEQINTDGRVDFSGGRWPFEKGRAGTTDSGVGWERVGSSFELPNGWVAQSDNGRVSVALPGSQLFGGSSQAGQLSPNIPPDGAAEGVTGQPSLAHSGTAPARPTAGPSLERIVPPAGNRSPGPTSPPLSLGMAIPGAGGPTSIGGPSGPTPLMPPVNSGSATPAPPAAPRLPPLHFAPETPRNSGPFTAAPLSFGLADASGAAPKPGGLLGMMLDAGVLPWNPNEFASAPIQSPGLVERWTRERPRIPGAPLRASATDPDQPFGTRGQFAPDRDASSQPLYDSRSFAAPAAGSADADDAKNVRVLRSYTRAPDGSLIPSPLPASNRPQSAQPTGLLSGKPMMDYPLVPIFGVPDRSATSDDSDDFFSRWIKPLFQQ